jgi:hypothetical protein|nr:MAG TPA: Protein of unknown function (DUF2634) [Caudoviricetes sp.]
MMDILVTENNDLEIIAGDFSIGDSLLQEVGFILQSQQGNWKSDPLIGANMVELIKGKHNRTAVEKRIKIQLERDGKDYDAIKKLLKLNTDNG